MKKHIRTITMAVLAGVVIYQVIFQRSIMTKTLQTTQKMDLQIDSLWSILHLYNDTRADYEKAYMELLLAQEELIAIRQEYSRISEDQQAEVLSIRQQLRQLILPTREVPIYESQSADSLRFRP